MNFKQGQPAWAGSPWQIESPGIMGNYTVADKVPQEMLYLVDPHW